MTVQTEQVDATVIIEENGEASAVVVELPTEETAIETENSDAVVIASIEAEAEVAIAEIEASVEIAQIEAATEREISWQEHNAEIEQLRTILAERDQTIAELQTMQPPAEADPLTPQVLTEAEAVEPEEAEPTNSTPLFMSDETSETAMVPILENADGKPVLEIAVPTRKRRRLI